MLDSLLQEIDVKAEKVKNDIGTSKQKNTMSKEQLLNEFLMLQRRVQVTEENR